MPFSPLLSIRDVFAEICSTSAWGRDVKAANGNTALPADQQIISKRFIHLNLTQNEGTAAAGGGTSAVEIMRSKRNGSKEIERDEGE